MRSARATVHAALPLMALAGLGLMSALRGTAPPEAVTQGSGTLSAQVVPTVVIRIVTDGHPQLVVLPAQHAPVVVPAPAEVPPVSRTVTRTRPRTVTVPAPPPAPVMGPAPQPADVPRTAQSTDAYPYRTDTTNASDPWGFTKRQCVSYVAWRLSEAGRPISNSAQGWGSALDWDDTARQLGYPISSRPFVGAVAQWNANEQSPYWASASSTPGTFIAGSMGHVAWVTKVYSDGSVLVAQYNGNGDRSYSTMHVKAPRYLSL